ncbi:hypothetical protein [Halopseudomonas sp.]|jgi:hypothetical protein|uniref:hypothetical protein n=1 Tax=Halopseudomonas sp. TaxID=2901191 RepID=UPI0030034518
MLHGYLFEARGIQSFLFASGKLRDMLNGSELLDYLCSEQGYLDQTLDALDLRPRVVRQAGGSFYLLFKNEHDARRLQAVWRLACAEWVPGLEVVDVVVSGSSARETIAHGLAALRLQRNRLQGDFPRPGPLADRAPRTGLAAVASLHGEALDASTLRQRSFERPQDNRQLTARFMSEEAIWPVNFEQDAPQLTRFPLGNSSLIGLVHADGNGLGELLRLIAKACSDADDEVYVRLYRQFSELVTRATLQATDEASRDVLRPHAEQGVMPARPLILGGDDLTLITRADLALPFVSAWIDAFERHSRDALNELAAAFEQSGLKQFAAELPERLTACAGVCFMKAGQPFRSGHELAESLCKRAKAHSRRAAHGAEIPSSIAWHKVQETLIDDAQALFERNHRIVDGDRTLDCSLGVYGLHAGNGLPVLDDLLALMDSFAGGLNDRPLREVATLLRGSLPLASQAYLRWRELAEKQAAAGLALFDQSLERLIGDVDQALPFSCGEHRYSPIDDLLALRSIQGKNKETGEQDV